MTSENVEYQDDKEAIKEAVASYLIDLKSIKHLNHPTKYERLLKLFEEADFEPLELQFLGATLSGNFENPEHSIQIKMSKLNTKLLPYGIQIERSSRYELKRIEPLDDENKG